MSDSANEPAGPRPWYLRIGPALITACVVIGPGSILTSSNVGARSGYGRSWVVVISVCFMLLFMSMGARLGVAAKQSAGSLIADRIGRWFAVLIGCSVFFISAAFQFGNNLGVHSALATYIDFDYLIVIFNALAIAFLLVLKNMYRALEKLMMVFVGLMLLAFAANLIMAGPRFGEWSRGFIPGATTFDLSILGLIGTTFVTTAAFYQSYLVRQKGWTSERLSDGMIDVRVGAVVMAMITLMLMATPATVFYPDYRLQSVVADAGNTQLDEKKTLVIDDDADPDRFQEAKERAEAEVDWKTKEPRWAQVLSSSEFKALGGNASLSPREFQDLPEIGNALRPLFGAIGPTLFFLGVFAAAFSSFLVNSMIGGFILADGMGMGERPEDGWPKVFTILVLLTGMSVGLYVILKGERPVPLIVAAQAVTVLASPIVAGSLLWLTSRRDVMGENVNSPLVNCLGLVSLLVLITMSGYTAITKVIPKITAALG